jgi:hypothetical protein
MAPLAIGEDITMPHNTNTYDPVVKPFVDLWSDYLKRADDAARDFLDEFDASSNVNTWQRRWHDALSKSLDAYMRTPAFLQAMKQNTDAAVKFKRQFDDLTTEVARNMNLPMASDISGLFERLHSIEEAILVRLGRIEKRLEKIEGQVDAGEAAELS